MVTTGARRTREIKSRIATDNVAFNRKKTLFTRKLGLNLRNKIVKCYIWSIALYGAEMWALRKLDQKYLECFQMWCWRRTEMISWTDSVRNEEVLHRVEEERNIFIYNKKERLIGLDTSGLATAFENTLPSER